MERYDVVVVGGGIMGAATAAALVDRGRRVALLERFEPGHRRGSSHSASRIFRLGYAEADYIRLGRRALDGWRALERSTGAQLLELTGALDHGPAAAITDLATAMAAEGVGCEQLDPAGAAGRWTGIRFDDAVLHHPDGGRIAAQLSVDVLQERARAGGAVQRFDCRVEALDPSGEGVVVRTADGPVRSDVVVVAAGAWAASVLSGLLALPPLQVSAENPFHFPARSGTGPFIPLIHRGSHDMYSLTTPDEGVKVSEHYRDEWLDPDDRPFGPDLQSLARVRAYVRDWLPGLVPDPVSSVRCLYTTTPSKDFVLDRADRIVVGAGFSGHGFKFAPAIGEVLADLAEGAVQDVARFRLDRADPPVHAGTR